MARPVLSAGSRAVIAASVAPATDRTYSKAVSEFLTYCDDLSISTTSPDDFDIFLTEYLNHIWESGKGKGKAKNTVYGIEYLMPHLKSRLLMAHRFLRGLYRLSPPQPWPPLTWDLTCAISIRVMLNGSFRAGVACLLAFHCFLRVGELVAVRPVDVIDSSSSTRRVGVHSPHMVLILPRTKTGHNQEVSVLDPFLASLVRQLVRSTPPTGRLFGCASKPAFRHRFKQACADLSLSESFVPHSLRHGGATEAYLLGRPIEDIQLRGRWKSTMSARHYIQQSRSLLASQHIPLSTRLLSSAIAKRLPVFISLSQSHIARYGQHSL